MPSPLPSCEVLVAAPCGARHIPYASPALELVDRPRCCDQPHVRTAATIGASRALANVNPLLTLTKG